MCMKNFKHKAEVPLTVTSIIITCILFFFITQIAEHYKWDDEVMSFVLLMLTIDTVYAPVLARFGMPLIFTYIVFIFVRILYVKKRYAGMAVSYDVKICDEQFPELYNACKEYAEKLNIEKIPGVYITNENINLTLFSVEVFGDEAVRIFADYVTAAIDNKRELLVAKFIIAKYLAHIYLEHNSLIFQVSTFFARCVPIYSSLYERALTYSADRVIQYLLGTEQTVKAIARISSEAWFYDYANSDIDIKEKLQSIGSKDKWKMFLTNLFDDEPLPAYRIEALTDASGKSGRLF